MMFDDAQKEMLSAKLDKSNVKTRKQGGSDVSYIEGWWVIAEANRIFGFDGWSRETIDTKMVSQTECKIHAGKPYEKDGWNVTYIAKVRIVVGDQIKDGMGAGHGTDANLGQAHESAIKEAETDAMKRSLMTFGNPFGLALYDKDQKNVETPKQIDYTINADTAEQFYDGFMMRLGQMPNNQAVDELMKTQANGLNRMKQDAPGKYAEVGEAVAKRRAELK